MDVSSPRTVVFQHDLGIGDLIFRLPYIRAIAQQSAGEKVTLIARPTAKARDLLRGEASIESIIEYDRGRKRDQKGVHCGVLGHWRLMKEIQQGGFERIVIFSGKLRYGLISAMAGIPIRIGYGGPGWGVLQRLFLTQGPSIVSYRGHLSSNYQLGTQLAILHGFSDVALVPRLGVPLEMESRWALEFENMPSRRYIFAVGASDKAKDWGMRNFAALATRLLSSGNGVICLAGPAEKDLLLSLEQQVPAEFRSGLRVLAPPSVLDSAAIARLCAFCIGNDTGMVNVAAACGLPAVLLIGNRPPLGHDPQIYPVTASSVAAISVDDVCKVMCDHGFD